MTREELYSAAQVALAAHGYQPSQTATELDVVYVGDAGVLSVVLLAAQPDAFAHLRAFEDGMHRLLAARQQQPSGVLALALDMHGAAQPGAASYRRALSKYRSSVVFEDAGIGLLLLGHPQHASRWLPPAEVSPFLRQLDRWLLAGP